MTPGLSVAICTRNGARRLPGVLSDLEREARSVERAWELVVVDNGSTDETRAVAESWSGRLPLRLASEPEPGLARARNRALATCMADVVLFVDDDVRLESGWLEAWCTELARYPTVGWFGGTVLPSWPEGKPAWVRDERLELLAGVYGLHRAATASEPHRDGLALPIGAHFAVRQGAVRAVGPFRPDLGLQGERRGLGEETEWFLRALRHRVPGRHLGTAIVLHPVPHARLTLAALFRHGVSSGASHLRIHPDAPSGSRGRAVLHVLRGVVQWMRGRGDLARQCVVNAGAELGARREVHDHEMESVSRSSEHVR